MCYDNEFVSPTSNSKKYTLGTNKTIEDVVIDEDASSYPFRIDHGIIKVVHISGTNTGAKPTDASTINFQYTQRFASNGSNISTETQNDIQLNTIVPEGLRDGLKLMVAGQTADIYLPYHKTYGDTARVFGTVTVPAKSDIIFRTTLNTIA